MNVTLPSYEKRGSQKPRRHPSFSGFYVQMTAELHTLMAYKTGDATFGLSPCQRGVTTRLKSLFFGNGSV